VASQGGRWSFHCPCCLCVRDCKEKLLEMTTEQRAKIQKQESARWVGPCGRITLYVGVEVISCLVRFYVQLVSSAVG